MKVRHGRPKPRQLDEGEEHLEAIASGAKSQDVSVNITPALVCLSAPYILSSPPTSTKATTTLTGGLSPE
jgi:hypothetical protein